MSTGPRPLGKYELYECLGQGGMGAVWKAFDPQLRRYVAIKLLLADLQADPGFVARFKREAQLIASLHHPNIVQIHDFQFADSQGSNPPTAYMVMDYVEGQTLATYIHNTSRIGKFPSATEIVHLFNSISQAIDYAHQKGMVHRDIKPANILLDKRSSGPGKRNPMGEPVLTDFGIARLQGPSTVVSSRLGLGTPLYISPEQAQGQPGDEGSDLYSLGVILYEMLTGVTPFRGDNVFSIMMQHYSAPPPPPASINPNISSAVCAVILRSLAKEPNARFPSASAMTIALSEAFNVPVPAELHHEFSSMNLREFQQSPSPSSSSHVASSPLPFAPSSNGEQTTPITGSYGATQATGSNFPPGGTRASTRTPTPTGNVLPVHSSPPVPASTQQPAGTERRRQLSIALVALIVIIVVGSGLGAFLLLAQKTSTTPIAPSPVVGHVFFASSGKTSQNTSQGIADELTIDLRNIPPPPAGKSYYAWLLGESNDSEAQPMLLGEISVDHGTVHYAFAGDQQHDNLLASTSSFLISAEDSTITPIVPSGARLYYATIPQTPAAADRFSLLDHLRHLLSEDPKLKLQGLHGGLDSWLLKNTKRVSQWASDARQTQNTAKRRQDIVDILYYLDGQACVQPDLQGVPNGTTSAPENAAITHIASVALLQLCGQLPVPGYLVHIGVHLKGVIHAPGATAVQTKLANQITTELSELNLLLKKVHQDAQQLVKLSDAQLLQPSAQALLNDLTTQATYAYSGQTSPSVQTGTQQIHDDIQRLATLDVTPCPSSSTANVCA